MGDCVCKSCGQTLPAPFEADLGLSRGEREILNIIYLAGEHGISTERLIDKVYAGDSNGGPENAPKSLHVRIHRLNKALKPRGWVVCGRGKHNGTYILTKMTLGPDAAAAVIRRALEAA